MDITIPRLNGIGAAQHIMAAAPDTLLVALPQHNAQRTARPEMSRGEISCSAYLNVTGLRWGEQWTHRLRN